MKSVKSNRDGRVRDVVVRYKINDQKARPRVKTMFVSLDLSISYL